MRVWGSEGCEEFRIEGFKAGLGLGSAAFAFRDKTLNAGV